MKLLDFFRRKNRLERRVEFEAAFDKRHPDPRKSYGIHGVTLRMYVIGKRGAVQFVVFTNWHLPHVQKEMDARGDHLLCHPMPADLGYHSPVPQYDGHESCRDDCELLGGRPCYYDGSGLNAKRIYHVLLSEGGDGVWRELEAYYHELFDHKPVGIDNTQNAQ